MLNSSNACLVLGYGNTLRQDDGAGYRVAEAVADWKLDNVRSLPVHQLTPDLAEAIAQAKIVIFVDAVAAEPATSTVTLETLEPQDAETFTGHYANPQSLLCLTQALYGTVPIAYRILIPAIHLNFGETLSPVTQTGVSIALEKIKNLLE